MSVFRRTGQYYSYGVSDNLAYNLQSRIEYGLIEIGAYSAVRFDTPMSGYCTLQGSYDRSLGGSGYVFEGFGPSWIWQEDVSVPNGMTQPTRASGVWINDDFYLTSTTVGQYSHKIDYRNGRVVFDSPLSPSDVVKCEYFMNDVDVLTTESRQWKRIVDDYASRFTTIAQTQPSGLASVLKENRIWLPSVFVEVDSVVNTTGLQLGGGQINDIRVVYHIFAERPADRKTLSDLLIEEEDRVLRLFDVNDITPPLSFDGTVASGALTYKDLTDQNSPYFWTFGFVESSTGGNSGQFPNLYRATIRQNIQVDRYNSTF